MSEPLLFKCIRGGQRIATIYYHWSGDLKSCYGEADKLIQGLKNNHYSSLLTDREVKLMLLSILHHNIFRGFNGYLHCGGADDLQPFIDIGYNELNKMYSVSRDAGIISITENDMDYYIRCCRGACMEFNFDNETVENTFFKVYDLSDEDDVEELDGIGITNDVIDNMQEFKFPDGVDYITNWCNITDAIKWADGSSGILGKIVDENGNPVKVIMTD